MMEKMIRISMAQYTELIAAQAELKALKSCQSVVKEEPKYKTSYDRPKYNYNSQPKYENNPEPKGYTLDDAIAKFEAKGYTRYTANFKGRKMHICIGPQKHSNHKEADWCNDVAIFFEGVFAKTVFFPEEDGFNKGQFGYLGPIDNKEALLAKCGNLQFRGRVTDVCRVHNGWNPAYSMEDVLSGKVMGVKKAVPLDASIPYDESLPFELDDIDWRA